MNSSIYSSFEFLAEKLPNVLENSAAISQSFSNDADSQVFIAPFENHFNNVINVIENGEYEFYLYAATATANRPHEIPAQLGLHNDIDILCNNLVASKDLIFELINLAGIKKDYFSGFDLIPCALLLYENLQLNYLKVLNSILDCGGGGRDFRWRRGGADQKTHNIYYNINNNIYNNINNFSNNNDIYNISNNDINNFSNNNVNNPQTISRFDRFFELITQTENIISNELYFYKIFNKFAYIDSRDIIINIIKPLSKRYNPFRSSNTFQVIDELNYFLSQFNSLIYQQKIQLRLLAMKFCRRKELGDKILEYIVYFTQYLNNQDFNIFSVAELWTAPFVFNDHIMYEVSKSHNEVEMCSSDLFFFTALSCIFKITKNFNINIKNEQNFNFIFKILVYISGYTNDLEFGSDGDFPFVKSAFTFPTVIYFVILIYFNILIDKHSLSATQNSKLVSLSIEKILHGLVGYGAFVWLRRLIAENAEFIDFETASLIHEVIVQFITVFQSCINSWFRQLNEPRYVEYFIFIQHFLLLICDFYGNPYVKRVFGDQNPLKIYFSSFDFDNMKIILPVNESPNYLINISLLNFILKLFASSVKFEMIQSLSFAFYGLSNSKTSAEYMSYLLEMYNMKSFLGSLNLHSENECSNYINWEKLLRLINDFPVYNTSSSHKIFNLLFNNSTPFYVARLISVIFKNFPEVIVEISQNQKYDLISNCVKYLISPDNENIKSSLLFLLKETVICGQINTHFLSLLDRFDFSDQQLSMKETPSFRCEFLRHSRVCSLLFSSSKKDSHLSLLSFTQLVNNILETYLDPKNQFIFKPCKIFKIYILFVYFEIFMNINSKTFSSSLVKWKVIADCLSILVKIIKYFSSQIENAKKSLVSVDIVPSRSLTLQDILFSFGIEFCKDLYQNDSSTQVFLDVIRKGISLLTSLHLTPKLVSIISKALDLSFEILIEMINLESHVLSSSSGFLPASTVYIPISEIISNAQVSEKKPVLFDLLNIFFVTQIHSKTIDTFSKIFCLCLKTKDSQKHIAHLLQNQSIVSQKIIHQFSGSWDHQVSISGGFHNLGKSMANFIINLFKYFHFEIIESLLYGVSLNDEKQRNTDSWLDYFKNRYYLCFPALMRSLYMSELIYETTDLVMVHERLFCILASSLSYPPHRTHLIPLIRTFNDCDLVFYILTVLNNRLNDVRAIMNPDSNKYIEYFLRLFGSIINIASIDLSEAFTDKNFTRVDKLLELLICKTKNETSLIVHLTKYSMSINPEVPSMEFYQDSCFSVQFIKSLTDKYTEEFRPFPKSIINMPLKLVNIENACHDLDLFHLLECNQHIDKVKFKRDRKQVIEYLNNRNRYLSILFSKRYILDSFNFCLSCMLITQSNSLKMLYNSDQELLDIIKQVIDYTFLTSSPDNNPIMNFQFSIMNTILCLTSVESFLSSCFQKMSVLCLPQNLIVIINHLIDYRSSKDLDIFNNHDFRQKYYSSFIYIKTTCDKMKKYWYLKSNPLTSTDVLSPYHEVNKHLFDKVSHHTFLNILLDDYLTENIGAQVSCIELILYLIKNDAIISSIPITEYLFYMDFYHNLLDFLMKNSHDFSSFINGNSKINQHQVRLLELIMSCFLYVLNQKGGIRILYVSNFITKLSDSNIIECLISLINNPFKSNIEDYQDAENAFQRVYCISIEILCLCLNVFTSLRKNILVSISKLFTKNLYAFKSVLEYSVIIHTKVTTVESRNYSYSKSFLNILSSTIKFTTDLACIRNKIQSQGSNPLLPYKTNIDPHLFDGINNLFECYVGLIKIFSDSQFVTSISSFYLDDLLMESNPTHPQLQSKIETVNFDPPPFSFKSITTIRDVGNILLSLVRYFQSFIYIDSISHNPTLSELIFFAENFIVNLANTKTLSEIYSFFKFNSTNTFNKPGINQLLRIMDILITWQKSINNSVLLIQRCSNSIDYSVELSSLSSFHSKWFDFVQDLPRDKQKEFCTRRLKRLREKYIKCSKFIYVLIERILFVVAVHAKFFEDRFFSKVSQHKITQIVRKNRVSEILDELLNNDQHSKIISQFISSIRGYFDHNKCHTLKEISFENNDNSSDLFEKLVNYFEEYFIEL